MQQVALCLKKSDLWIAARQQAVRWQGLLARLPLFLLTLFALYALGFGLLRNAAQMTPILQILILIGYSVVYWVGFIGFRLLRGWWRARSLARALFQKDVGVCDLVLEVEGGRLRLMCCGLDIGLTQAMVPSFYLAPGFIFLDSPLIAWLPIPRTDASLALLTSLRESA